MSREKVFSGKDNEESPLGAELLSDPDPDCAPVDLRSLEILLRQVVKAADDGNIVVIAVYTLPCGCVMGKPTTPATSGIAPSMDGLNRIPPGLTSAIYNFPIVPKESFNKENGGPLLSARFDRENQIQAVIATSNYLYLSASAHAFTS